MTKLADEIRAIERRSEQRLRALVEQSSDVVTVLGRDLLTRWQAGSIRRVLGHEPGSLIERAITSIVHPDERALFDGFLRATVDGNGQQALRARMRHADGRWCHVESSAENRFADPAIGGLVVTLRDVSERTAFFTSDQGTGVLVEFGPTTQIFASPIDERTEDYITGRFG